jgi:hypothetical protein
VDLSPADAGHGDIQNSNVGREDPRCFDQAVSKFASGQVFLPTEASWLDQLEMELFSFPGGRFDDQIDSIGQALAHEIPTYEWTDEALAGFERLVGGLLFDPIRSCPVVW